MGYHQFNINDAEPYGSFEVFHINKDDAVEFARNQLSENIYGADDAEDYVGFYWRACFPGCLPDGEASGPHRTYQAAMDDANDI
tara:strand:- start:273 stop:524 length:252 start_codon:yes stop_codon:yes gene_type:complete